MNPSLPLFQESRFGKYRNKIRCFEAVTNVARRLWPVKTAANLAGRCDVGVRAAELWMEGRNDISAEALVNLLRTDAGFEVLTELMQGAPSKWWSDFERGVRIADLEKRMNYQKAEFEKMKAGFVK